MSAAGAVSPAATGDGFRRLVLRFLDLRVSEKAGIMAELGLSEPEEAALPELDRNKAALRRARERGLLERLDRAVAVAEGNAD